MHFTPTYSSWDKQVERVFSEVTPALLQRSDHRSVQTLEKDLREWVAAWNEDQKPFIWTKAAEEILASIGRLRKQITGPRYLLFTGSGLLRRQLRLRQHGGCDLPVQGSNT